MKKTLSTIFLLITTVIVATSMNVKSLELNYENIGGLTYRGNIVFYLYDPSPIEPLVEINWGDGAYSFLSQTSITDIPGELKRVVYSGVHTYSAPSTFTMFVSYKVRSINVINVPMSIITDIYAEALIVVSPFLSGTKSPLFYNNPKANICRGEKNIIDLSAYDADGDKLLYSLIPCKGENGSTISGYSYPSVANDFSIDQNTGIVKWDTPQKKGFYNFAVKVSKYRNGILLGTVMRDVLINVIDCTPENPILFGNSDTCLIAGAYFSKNISANYTGSDSIVLTASGEPFLLQDKCSFQQPRKGKHSISSQFEWNVSCKHVRPEPYKIAFKAELEDSLSSCDCTYRFNDYKLAPFSSNVPIMFSNPCGDGWDGTSYLWIGADSAAPRHIISPPIDMSFGNYMVVFDMRFSDHTGNSGTNCEGPDLPDEGIYLQYSVNGINGPWQNIAYWDPSLSPGEGGHMKNLIEWSNYSVVAPDEALSSHTRFRWSQFHSSGKHYDHWGLDNIAIKKISDKLPAISEMNVVVIAPEPKNLTANLIGNTAILKWNKEVCDTEANGYNIYRKAAPSGYIPANCDTGVPGWTGYKLIAITNNINDTTFIDNNNGKGLPHGNEYCYIATAWFENGAISRASNEACVILPDETPVLTNVSVISTNNEFGKIFIAWSKPDVFDQTHFNGPYRYDIYRATDINSFTMVGSNYGLNDTTFVDSLFDTKTKKYFYKIDLMFASGTSNYMYYSSAFPASSVYLNIIPKDKKLSLRWKYNVPWNNDSAIIYRFNENTNNFDSIATSYSNEYIDTSLINGKNYCYKVETSGSYSIPGYVFPIKNFSQEMCMAPMDIEPPCEVVLNITSNCEENSNSLKWTNPEITCGDKDLGKYFIYYSQTSDNEFTLLDSVTNKNSTEYLHKNKLTVAGCYAVVAIDTNGNRSKLSNIVCVDIDQCDLYRLPNIFTPNNDQHNDFFRPFPYDFVEKIDIKIFDRWGSLMFETQNPDILWDGKNKTTRLDCSEGVYYYVCEVYELRLAGIRKRIITSTVHLYR